MSTQKRRGFTIIEVMLFLAITGALTVGILVGSGATIGRQRYRDSVNSFKGLIQDQYSQITNVVNSEPQNPTCTPANPTLLLDASSQQARGTSKCLVIGRFVLIQPTTVTTYNLIGQLNPALEEQPMNGGDTDTLSKYFMTVESPETYTVSWGAKIVWPKSKNEVAVDEATMSMVIVRSPLSGSILTYVADGDQLGALKGMISDDNMVQKELCVDPDGGLLTRARRQAVRIRARAANQSAIEIPLESDNICD